MGAARARWWFCVAGTLATIALPLIAAALAWRAARRPLPGVIAKALGRAPRLPAPPILLHGVSLGEVGLMRPLLPLFPGPCLLTASTDTGWQGLARQFPDRARACWPFDLPWAVARFLARARPRAIVLLEAEVWPLMLWAAAARSIPVLVLNARVSERSFRRWSRLLPLARRLFGTLRLAVAQDAAYAARLVALGVPRARVAIAGSLKADMVQPASADAAVAEARRLGLDAAPLLLLASTSAPEEEPLLAAWQRAARPAGWRLVIVPRHPERGAELAALCRRLGIPARRSSADPPDTADEAVIVDEIGRLAALYAWCARVEGIAVVGGSLGSGRGGQNMLEAAAAGCCTVVGWDTRAQPEPMRLLRQAQAVVELAPGDLAAQLAPLIADGARRRRLGEAARAAWARGRGALARTRSILQRKGLP